MKYIILESKINRLVNLYLDEELRDLKMLTRPLGGGELSHRWIKNDEPIFIVNSKGLGSNHNYVLEVSFDFLDLFRKLFSLDVRSAHNYIIDWVEDNLKISPSRITIF